jgi:hypothetical protein
MWGFVSPHTVAHADRCGWTWRCCWSPQTHADPIEERVREPLQWVILIANMGSCPASMGISSVCSSDIDQLSARSSGTSTSFVPDVCIPSSVRCSHSWCSRWGRNRRWWRSSWWRVARRWHGNAWHRGWSSSEVLGTWGGPSGVATGGAENGSETQEGVGWGV